MLNNHVSKYMCYIHFAQENSLNKFETYWYKHAKILLYNPQDKKWKTKTKNTVDNGVYQSWLKHTCSFYNQKFIICIRQCFLPMLYEINQCDSCVMKWKQALIPDAFYILGLKWIEKWNHVCYTDNHLFHKWNKLIQSKMFKYS